MKNVSKDQRGLGHVVPVLLIVLVVAVVAYAGYRVAHRSNEDNGNLAGSTAVAPVKAPAQIKTRADLSQADKALSSLAIDSSVNPNSLNRDLNAIR